jgi:hypothetical protein
MATSAKHRDHATIFGCTVELEKTFIMFVLDLLSERFCKQSRYSNNESIDFFRGWHPLGISRYQPLLTICVYN